MGREQNFSAIVVRPGDESLRAWMTLAAPDIGSYDLISREDLEQRFSLGLYLQMVKNGISDDELYSIILEDARAYIEEYVLKVKVGIKEFSLRDGDLYSGKYGEESFLTMCRKTVLARELQGLDSNRAKHEGLGVANIVKLLEVADVGQVVMLVSPPYDPSTYDNNKPYSMLYLYQKQEDGRVWFGAVRDETRSIIDWQQFAREESLWQTDWREYDDLKFVALPMIAKQDLRGLLHTLGIEGVESIPEWMEREAKSSAKMLTNNLSVGNNGLAQRVLDAFKVVVVGGRHQTDSTSEGYSVAQTVLDYRYGWLMHRMFMDNGGDRVLAAGGLCGGDSLATQWGMKNNLMSDAYGLDDRMMLMTGEKPETEKSSELADGETACYPCPLCGGEVKRSGSELVCQKNPSDHHIKYQSQVE